MKEVEQEDRGGEVDGGGVDGGEGEISRTRWMDGSGGEKMKEKWRRMMRGNRGPRPAQSRWYCYLHGVDSVVCLSEPQV